VDEVVRLPAFVRLDAAIGWRLSSASKDVRIEPSTGELELGFVGTRLSPLTEAGGSFGGLTLPTGVAVAPDGTVLVADPEHGVILRNPHPGLFGPGAETAPGFAPLWPATPAPATPPAPSRSLPRRPVPTTSSGHAASPSPATATCLSPTRGATRCRGG
jgi:hypothetical protein